MQNNCKQCSSNFDISNNDIDFLNKLSPIFNWKKYNIPTPTLCPNCRQQRRMAWRNNRTIHKRKCDSSSEDIISMYSSDKAFPVYKNSEWFSDKWNALDYWKEFDFNKTFFEQFSSLMQVVPLPALSVLNMENSEFNNNAWQLKNCYLVFNADSSEDCYYWDDVYSCKSCIDVYQIANCESSYQIVNCSWSYNLFYWELCDNCSNSYFLKNCSWCKNCFSCTNLRNKQYCFLNEQLSKEQYENRINNIDLWKHSVIQKYKKEFDKFCLKFPNKNVNLVNCSNVIWNNVSNSNNCYYAFNSRNIENCKYVSKIKWWDNLQDVDIFWLNLSFAYDSSIVWQRSRNICFTIDSWEWVSDIYYSWFVTHNSSNCFWCIGIKHKKYCILNKQYTKEQYEILVPRIIEHMKKTHSTSSELSCGQEWWEFFPIEMSPFAYNETLAQEYHPLTKEKCLNTYSKLLFDDNTNAWTRLTAFMHKGWKWKDQKDQIPDVEKIIPAQRLPDNIKDTPDDILAWAIKCEVSEKPYKITAQELKFYRQHNIPIPHLHPDERHSQRVKLKNLAKLYNRKCMKCEKDIQSIYSQDRDEIIYCEECYLGEVY